MALRNLTNWDDLLFRKKSRSVEKFDERLWALLDDMLETLETVGGYGCAAVHVGILRRAVVINDESGVIELINPGITEESTETQDVLEGSIAPGAPRGTVVRPQSVTVSGFDRNDKPITVSGSDFLAATLCHEIDHLDGILFTDKVKGKKMELSNHNSTKQEVTSMQISLTKKFATAIGVKPATGETVNPIFWWTANWTNTFDNRKEDMVVMVNHATRFAVTIYGVKRNQLGNIEAKMIAAIKNTLLAMNLNPELVDAYISLAGDITYASSHDRKMTAQVNHQGLNAAFVVGRAVNESRGSLKFEDTLGGTVSRRPVGYSNSHEDSFIPAVEMIKALTELTDKPAYKYRAFELLATLDLEVYKATRRLIVPADMPFHRFHKVLQEVFGWKNYHLYDFSVFDDNGKGVCARLVPDEESLSYDDDAVLMDGHKLSEYLPKHKHILYTYDMGDSWEHEIELVRIIDEHNEESPYLLEASGQTPPEDVGGVGGFIDFREIMLDPNHPEYAQTKEWAEYWSPELREWEARPKVIY